MRQHRVREAAQQDRVTLGSRDRTDGGLCLVGYHSGAVLCRQPTGESCSSDCCAQVRGLGKCRVVKPKLLQLSISSKGQNNDLEPRQHMTITVLSKAEG